MDTRLTLEIERPVAGGRMLARHDGRVVLVSGTIPGERVVARVERVSKKVVFASTVDVIEPSPDRRPAPFDPSCGALAYAHVTPERQRRLKAEVIRDAFRRIGRLTLENVIPVAASPESAYRLRGRLHMQKGRAGLYVERSHRLCDPADSGQFRPDSLEAVDRLLARLGDARLGFDALVVSENVTASERVIHLEPASGHAAHNLIGQVAAGDGLTGITTVRSGRLVCLAGHGRVSDATGELCGQASDLPADLRWSRSPTSFFQGNRYLTGTLLLRVLASVRGTRVFDLYAGVGLFSLGLAARGASVTAVESEPSSAADLEANADQFLARITPRQTTVEAAVLTARRGAFDTIVLDPPRLGASAPAIAGITALQPDQIVYVSCDPATLARDSAALMAAGYGMSSLEAFDFFPNTPHVETLAVFDRASRS